MTAREKALNYLLSHCRHGQRTKDLQEKLAFVQLEIELDALLQRERGAPAGNILPMAANFARRDDDPGAHSANGGSGR